MKEKNQFYVISKDVLPEVFVKVMEVKELLEAEKLLTVQEATERVGISRSSFYKYKLSKFCLSFEGIIMDDEWQLADYNVVEDDEILLIPSRKS